MRKHLAVNYTNIDCYFVGNDIPKHHRNFICNYLGNQRWVEQMKWSGQDAFNKQPVSTFSVDGDAGQGKEYGGLSFLRVHSAGHMVPMDQPKASLEMLRRFVTGEPMFPPQKANSVL